MNLFSLRVIPVKEFSRKIHRTQSFCSSAKDCGKKFNVFGKTHLDEIAAQFELPILARLPIDPAVAEAYDGGLMETVNTDALMDAVKAVENI